MSYVDAILDSKNEVVKVIERVDGKRVYKDFQLDHHFYMSAKDGEFNTIYGNAVTKVTPDTKKAKYDAIKTTSPSSLWESDMNPVFRCLETNYLDVLAPKLNVAFFDIEVDFDKDFGYSDPADALTPVTSIAIYLQWLERMVCIAVPPKGVSMAEARAIAEEVGDTIIVGTERELLLMFLDIIQDSDVLSGWNSAPFDVLYTVNRIIKILGKSYTRKLCLWEKEPRKKTFLMGTKELQTYELVGRIHLDYLELYKKYNYDERQSYSLDNIAREELGTNKVEYDGTLDQLYNNDFKKFLEYNIQDTKLLDDLDKKLRFIELANELAHSSVVPIQSTMGSVAITEQAIVVEAHKRGLVVMNKSRDGDVDARAAGGWVSHPIKGFHRWIGSVDLNSLYPSVIRALNMSPETIIGQIRLTETNAAIEEYMNRGPRFSFAMWWNDRFHVNEMDYVYGKDAATMLDVDFEDGNSYKMTGAELYNLVYESGQPWQISANGTIFRNDKIGIIPSLLTRWYAERKEMQYMAKTIDRINGSKFEIPANFNLPDITEYAEKPSNLYDFDIKNLQSIVANNDTDALVEIMKASGLKLGVHVEDPNKVVITCIDEWRDIWEDAHSYWDKKQLVTKILLNSCYGGLLNEHHRMFDQRIGQSTTLTGRSITHHMSCKMNEIVTGKYELGESYIYSDTDSVVGSTDIETSNGTQAIEDLFDQCQEKDVDAETGKEYAYDDDVMVMSYNKDTDEPYLGHINYVYRHEVTKDLYEVEDTNGNKVTVTEDHSIMVERDNELIEAKPQDIMDDDVIICINVNTKR